MAQNSTPLLAWLPHGRLAEQPACFLAMLTRALSANTVLTLPAYQRHMLILSKYTMLTLQESQHELTLHRQVKDMELELAEKTKQCVATRFDPASSSAGLPVVWCPRVFVHAVAAWVR